MVWFKVDDDLAMHPKVLLAGNAAMGLWVRAGSWSAHLLTDGYVPLDMVRTLGSKAAAERLVDAGLWVHAHDGGYQFHEWHSFQPSRKAVHESRRAGAERLAEWRRRQREGG